LHVYAAAPFSVFRVMMDGHPKVLKDAQIETDFIEQLRRPFAAKSYQCTTSRDVLLTA
jgi:hypothetical protein